MRKKWTAENACERSLYSEKKIAKNTTRRKSERLKVFLFRRECWYDGGGAAARCLCCLCLRDWIFVLGIKTSLSSSRGFDDCARRTDSFLSFFFKIFNGLESSSCPWSISLALDRTCSIRCRREFHRFGRLILANGRRIPTCWRSTLCRRLVLRWSLRRP